MNNNNSLWCVVVMFRRTWLTFSSMADAFNRSRTNTSTASCLTTSSRPRCVTSQTGLRSQPLEPRSQSWWGSSISLVRMLLTMAPRASHWSTRIRRRTKSYRDALPRFAMTFRKRQRMSKPWKGRRGLSIMHGISLKETPPPPSPPHRLERRILFQYYQRRGRETHDWQWLSQTAILLQSSLTIQAKRKRWKWRFYDEDDECS